eukprot:1132987-Pelagomonas_calceolata.AAC.1
MHVPCTTGLGAFAHKKGRTWGCQGRCAHATLPSMLASDPFFHTTRSHARRLRPQCIDSELVSVNCVRQIIGLGQNRTGVHT